MTILDQAGSALSGFSWASVGAVVTTIAVVMFVLMFVGVLVAFVLWKSYDIPVKIYAPYGQVNTSKEDIEDMQAEAAKGDQTTVKGKEIKYDIIKFKRTHGKFVTVKGASYFATFRPLKKHQTIPMEMLYSDGVHLLRLAKDVFIPIPKPEFVIGVGESTILSVKDNNDWRQFSNTMAERINSRYTPAAEARRMTAYFVIGIVAIVMIGGFMLWLLYQGGGRIGASADKLSNVLASWTTSAKPPV